MPAPLNGWLCENGARILDIESYHDGMGLFSFVPQEGIRYTVTNQWARVSSSHISPFGHGNAFGTHRQEKCCVLGEAAPKGSMPRRITLFVQMRNVPCCRAKGILRDSHHHHFAYERVYRTGMPRQPFTMSSSVGS